MRILIVANSLLILDFVFDDLLLFIFLSTLIYGIHESSICHSPKSKQNACQNKLLPVEQYFDAIPRSTDFRHSFR